MRETKERIYKKQLLFLEMIKQRISIEKLQQRNIEAINEQVLSDINIEKAIVHSEAERLHLPLLFVECKPNSKVNISQDEKRVHLRLISD